MATLADLEIRIATLEGLLASTKRIRELTLTQTQNPATTLSGGVFSFDGGGFVIPSVADGIAPQDVATVNQLNGSTPINTVFVTTEADLPATALIDTGAFGIFDFHVVTTDTQFIWVDSPPILNGIKVNPGIKCIITSANKDGARILPNFTTDATRLFLYVVAADSLTVKDVEIDETSGNPLSKTCFFTSGTTNVSFENVTVKNFPAFGNPSQNVTSNLDVINCDVEDLTITPLTIIAPNTGRIINNRWAYTGVGSVILFLGTSTASFQVLGNTSTNSSAFLLGVSDTLGVNSRFQVSNNFTNPNRLFNSGAGFFTESDKQIIATDNIYNADSRIGIRLFVNDNVPVNQTPLVVNTPKEIVGFTYTVDGTPERFEVTTNAPGSTLLLTYKGNKARMPIIFEASLDGNANEDLALGVFKNGTAISSTFVGRAQPATSAQPSFQVTNVGIELAFNDEITFGIENQSSGTEVFLTNPVIFIGSALTTF